MLKTILRLEHELGFGPFEYGPKMWQRTHDEELIDAYFFAFADAMPWVTVRHSDPIEQLFGKPERYWSANDGQHPHHIEDVKEPEGYGHTWKVGCKDMDQLLHWFPKSSHAMLSQYGFQLVTYECECDYIQFGTYQLLFCVDNITVVTRAPLLG